MGIPTPNRLQPASDRTAELPPITSLEDLRKFLFEQFGIEESRRFWITAEEICDIVEHSADIVQVQWDVTSSLGGFQTTYVTLFNKGKAGRNIEMVGLIPFPSETAAKQFCYDDQANPDFLFGQLEELWGIEGRFATKFMGRSGNFAQDFMYKKEKNIDAFDLWGKICERRVSLGLVPKN
jgi:hypothetical protein